MNAPLALMESPSGTVSGQRDFPVFFDAISDRHRRVARMIGFGFCDESIAEACDMHPRSVWDIRHRPEVQAYVSRLKDLARLELLERKNEFDALLQSSIDVYRGILTDTNTSPHLRFKVACEVFDRHPDRQFVRDRKTTTEKPRPVVDSEAIKRLKEIAAKTNVEMNTASDSPTRLSQVTP